MKPYLTKNQLHRTICIDGLDGEDFSISQNTYVRELIDFNYLDFNKNIIETSDRFANVFEVLSSFEVTDTNVTFNDALSLLMLQMHSADDLGNALAIQALAYWINNYTYDTVKQSLVRVFDIHYDGQSGTSKRFTQAHKDYVSYRQSAIREQRILSIADNEKHIDVMKQLTAFTSNFVYTHVDPLNMKKRSIEFIGVQRKNGKPLSIRGLQKRLMTTTSEHIPYTHVHLQNEHIYLLDKELIRKDKSMFNDSVVKAANSDNPNTINMIFNFVTREGQGQALVTIYAKQSHNGTYKEGSVVVKNLTKVSLDSVDFSPIFDLLDLNYFASHTIAYDTHTDLIGMEYKNLSFRASMLTFPKNMNIMSVIDRIETSDVCTRRSTHYVFNGFTNLKKLKQFTSIHEAGEFNYSRVAVDADGNVDFDPIRWKDIAQKPNPFVRIESEASTSYEDFSSIAFYMSVLFAYDNAFSLPLLRETDLDADLQMDVPKNETNLNKLSSSNSGFGSQSGYSYGCQKNRQPSLITNADVDLPDEARAKITNALGVEHEYGCYEGVIWEYVMPRNTQPLLCCLKKGGKAARLKGPSVKSLPKNKLYPNWFSDIVGKSISISLHPVTQHDENGQTGLFTAVTLAKYGLEAIDEDVLNESYLDFQNYVFENLPLLMQEKKTSLVDVEALTKRLETSLDHDEFLYMLESYFQIHVFVFQVNLSDASKTMKMLPCVGHPYHIRVKQWDESVILVHDVSKPYEVLAYSEEDDHAYGQGNFKFDNEATMLLFETYHLTTRQTFMRRAANRYIIDDDVYAIGIAYTEIMKILNAESSSQVTQIIDSTGHARGFKYNEITFATNYASQPITAPYVRFRDLETGRWDPDTQLLGYGFDMISIDPGMTIKVRWKHPVYKSFDIYVVTDYLNASLPVEHHPIEVRRKQKQKIDLIRRTAVVKTFIKFVLEHYSISETDEFMDYHVVLFEDADEPPAESEEAWEQQLLDCMPANPIVTKEAFNNKVTFMEWLTEVYGPCGAFDGERWVVSEAMFDKIEGYLEAFRVDVSTKTNHNSLIDPNTVDVHPDIVTFNKASSSSMWIVSRKNLTIRHQLVEPKVPYILQQGENFFHVQRWKTQPSAAGTYKKIKHYDNEGSYVKTTLIQSYRSQNEEMKAILQWYTGMDMYDQMIDIVAQKYRTDVRFNPDHPSLLRSRDLIVLLLPIYN